MKIGFTGTREGMTQAQKKALRILLANLFRFPAQFHHGDCVGADAEARECADQGRWYLVCHPPVNRKLRAFTDNHATRPVRAYAIRNQAIAEECDVLVAAPKSYRRVGGTWDTVKRARALGKPVFILDPGEQ